MKKKINITLILFFAVIALLLVLFLFSTSQTTYITSPTYQQSSNTSDNIIQGWASMKDKPDDVIGRGNITITWKSKSTSTMNTGAYALHDAEIGVGNLIYSYPGYRNLTIPLNFSRGGMLTISVDLYPLDWCVENTTINIGGQRMNISTDYQCSIPINITNITNETPTTNITNETIFIPIIDILNLTEEVKTELLTSNLTEQIAIINNLNITTQQKLELLNLLSQQNKNYDFLNNLLKSWITYMVLIIIGIGIFIFIKTRKKRRK